jgi:hypothetical protein
MAAHTDLVSLQYQFTAVSISWNAIKIYFGTPGTRIPLVFNSNDATEDLGHSLAYRPRFLFAFCSALWISRLKSRQIDTWALDCAPLPAPRFIESSISPNGFGIVLSHDGLWVYSQSVKSTGPSSCVSFTIHFAKSSTASSDFHHSCCR